MAKDKLKMSSKRFMAITIPILSIMLILIVVVTIVMGTSAVTMDTIFGRGTRHIQNAEGTENWDLNYYGEKPTAETAKENAYKVAAQVQDEGTVLLKNNGILPLQKGSTVTPFGYRYKTPIYGQLTSSGSAKWPISPVTPADGLKGYLEVNDAAVKKMSGTPTALIEAEGTISAGDVDSLLGGDSKIYEYNPSIYNGITGINGTTGLVLISRAGQEGSDKKWDAYTDGTRHYLALSQNEKDTIKFAKQNCGKVVVVFVTSAPMELAPLMSGECEADAILWYGHPGERGFNELGKILTGEVNPSGRTVDIFATDFLTSPAMVNFGMFTYENVYFTHVGTMEKPPVEEDGFSHRTYMEYQEDMYVGYRYYETAEVMDSSFDYSKEVVFPFGYGLSYSQFEQKIVGFNDLGDEISVKVEVTNKSDRDGKEVVQLYYTAPYTEFDVTNKIEKPVKNLIAFDKISVAKNSSKTVTLSFTKEEMASYCYTHKNSDDTTGCYVLEKGDYTITLGKNSHDVWDTKSTHIGSTIWYDNNNPRKTDKDAQSALNDDGEPLGFPIGDPTGDFSAATNLFSDSSDYMTKESSILTRNNWKGSFPAINASRRKSIKTEQFKTLLDFCEDKFDYKTDPLLGNVKGSAVYTDKMPAYANNGLTLADLRGKDYNDESWDLLLNQIDWSDKDVKNAIIDTLCFAGYVITEVPSIGLPTTAMFDGINGLKVGKLDADMDKTSSTGFSPLMAATWNAQLIEDMGYAFGQEGIAHGVSGWYAPAINLHRSPFSGRVFEYFSEDPVLSGKLAAAMISGAGNAGMVTYVKHCAMNDQETGRQYLVCTWATEQAMRELYFKPFEIAIKEARMEVKYIADTEGTVATKVMRAATGMMSAQNSVGNYRGHTSYAMQTELLRNEWGFRGIITTDYNMYFDNAEREMAFRTGADLWLNEKAPWLSFLGDEWTFDDTESATAINVYRNALHNIGYAIANSNAMQGAAPGAIIYYDMSPWIIWLIVANVLVYAVIIAGVVWIILRTLDDKKHPDKYKHDQKI